jgi:hypothetical protein
VITIALVPVLIGAGHGRSLADALVHGFQPAMIALGALCVASALVTAVLISDERTAGPRLTPHPRIQRGALPAPNSDAA